MSEETKATAEVKDIDPREYCKMRYSAPPECCKCGHCQLVPLAQLRHWSDTIGRMDDQIDSLQASIKVLEEAL